MITADEKHVARNVLLLVLVVAVVAGVRVASALEHVPLEQGVRDDACRVDCHRRGALVRFARAVKSGQLPLSRPTAACCGVTSRRNLRPGPGSVAFALGLLLVSQIKAPHTGP